MSWFHPRNQTGKTILPRILPETLTLRTRIGCMVYLFLESLNKKQCVLSILALTLHSAHSIWMRSMKQAFFPISPTGRASRILWWIQNTKKARRLAPVLGVRARVDTHERSVLDHVRTILISRPCSRLRARSPMSLHCVMVLPPYTHRQIRALLPAVSLSLCSFY